MPCCMPYYNPTEASANVPWGPNTAHSFDTSTGSTFARVQLRTCVSGIRINCLAFRKFLFQNSWSQTRRHASPLGESDGETVHLQASSLCSVLQVQGKALRRLLLCTSEGKKLLLRVSCPLCSRFVKLRQQSFNLRFIRVFFFFKWKHLSMIYLCLQKRMFRL